MSLPPAITLLEDGTGEAVLAVTEVASNLTNNFTATSNPAVTDDADSYYAVGSTWVNVTADTAYVCVDSTSGAAVWVNITAGAGGGDSWGDAVDADVIPDADGTRDLGATATRFAETYTDALDVTNNITVGGTVDGIDIATDVAANTAKTTNATHTGDVTGSTALSVDKTAISGQTPVTAVGTDYVLIGDASDSDNLKKALVSDLTGAGAGGGISNVVEDATPQLGGDLDANGSNIGFDDATGIEDDSGNELLIFQKTASATRYLEIKNTTTGSSPEILAAGDDSNINISLRPKGTGYLELQSDINCDGNNIVNPGTVDGIDIATDVAANTLKTSNATHTGDVTGSTALTIAAGAVDLSMMSATGTPSSSTFLRGDNTWTTPSGSGDVSGPASSTDNAIATFDSTTGKIIQQNHTDVVIDDSDNITGVNDLTVGGVLDASAGAAVLGTPASGTLTNCTGLPTAGLTDERNAEFIALILDGADSVITVGMKSNMIRIPYGYDVKDWRVISHIDADRDTPGLATDGIVTIKLKSSDYTDPWTSNGDITTMTLDVATNSGFKNTGTASDSVAADEFLYAEVTATTDTLVKLLDISIEILRT